MSDSNAMDLDPPAPAADVPISAADDIQVSQAASPAEQSAQIPEQPAQTTAAIAQTSTQATDAVDVDAAPSNEVREVGQETSSTPLASTATDTAGAMAIDKGPAIQQTTEMTTITIQAENGTVVQEQTTTTTEVAVAVEDVPMEAEPEPSVLERMVTAHTSPPADPAVITTVSRAEPVAPAPPLDVRAPAQIQPTIARTGYVFDPMMMLHCQDGYVPTADDRVESGSGHPEEPMRIRRIFNRLAEQGLVKRMKPLSFGQVTMEEILLVHSEDHWNKVQGTESEFSIGIL